MKKYTIYTSDLNTHNFIVGFIKALSSENPEELIVDTKKIHFSKGMGWIDFDSKSNMHEAITRKLTNLKYKISERISH